MQAAGHLIAMLHQRVDFQIGEAIEVGADRGDLRLHHRVEGVGIFVWIDDAGDRGEMEAVAIAKIFPFQLPDPIPEDVGGADRLRDKPQRGIAQHLERLAGIAHEDSAVGFAPLILQPGKGPRAEIVVHAAIGERFIGKFSLVNAQILGREFHRGKKAGEGGGCRHHLGHAGGLAGNVAKRIGIPHAPLLDMEAIPVEHCQHAIADVGGEDMQQRLFRQLKQPAIAVEKPAVVALQQGIGGEAGRFPAGELGSQPEGIEERKPANDPVPHIKLRHRDDLGGRLRKLLVTAGIALPVEHQMSRQHASPRHRGDVGYQRQRAVVAQVAQHPQMVKRGPEAAAGKCQTKTCHGVQLPVGGGNGWRRATRRQRSAVLLSVVLLRVL